MRVLILTLGAAGLLGAQSFPAFHNKDFGRDVRGEIRITNEAIEFHAEKEKHNRRWEYADIQHFDRLSESEFVVMSYEDQRMFLGRDRRYHFVLTEGKLADELFESIVRRIGKPATDRVVSTEGRIAYSVPVKHLHALGGCEGELRFREDMIVYSTEHKADSREWLIDRDIDSVWSSNPYQIEIHVHEDNRREFSRTRVFKFDLKKKIDNSVYKSLKLRLFALK